MSKLPKSWFLSMSVAAALLLSAIAGALAGCSHTSGSVDGVGRTAESAAVADVTITHVERSDISKALTLTGSAAAPLNQDVRVSSLVPGRIIELNVAEGDRVTAGQVLAKLDDHQYHDQLKQAQAAVQQAKASLENAKLNEARNADLFQRGIAARKDLEDARTQETVAAAALQQSEAAFELSQLAVNRTSIISPINGMIAKRFVSVGEQVDGTATQPIVEVANLREVEFLGNAPAMYLEKLHPGQPVVVTTEVAPGQKFPGHVVAISPAVDPATGVGVVRIRVPNPSRVLRMGIFLNAEIPIETHANALTVPPAAVYRDEAGETRVFLVNKDSAVAIPVKVGIETKDRVELLPPDVSPKDEDTAKSAAATPKGEQKQFVKEGDTVILTGGYGLGDNAKIRTSPQSTE
jgi:RND family efflux transporter MFP subunit